MPSLTFKLEEDLIDPDVPGLGGLDETAGGLELPAKSIGLALYREYCLEVSTTSK